MQQQIGRRGDAGEQPVSLIFETRVALPAHRLGRDAPSAGTIVEIASQYGVSPATIYRGRSD
jgi:transposase-like protein